MFLTDKVSLLILVLTLGAQVLYRRSFWFPKFSRSGARGNSEHFFLKSLSSLIWIIWILSIIIVFSFLVSDSFAQYWFWSVNPVSKHFLPPDANISYFLSYVGFRFFAPWILAFLAAVIISRLARRLNRRFGERFFENEEIGLMALGIFLTGYPGFFVYLFLILTVGVLFSILYSLLSRGRLPLYYFWMPFAIFAIIIQDWLVPKLGLTSFFGQFILGDFGKLIFGF